MFFWTLRFENFKRKERVRNSDVGWKLAAVRKPSFALRLCCNWFITADL